MRIDRYDFDSQLTQAQVDAIFNSMLVNLSEFSEYASLNGRMYGVKTQNDQKDITIDAYLRNQVILLLWSSQQIVEKQVGFPLTTRYVEETLTYRPSGLLQLKFPIDAINVAESFSAIDGFLPFSISPFIEENIPIEDSGDGYCIAEIDSSLSRNPSQVTFRDDTYRAYSAQHKTGFPRRNFVGNWEIALDKSPAPPCETTLHVQHHEYMVLEILDPADCEGTVVPVYPNSNQIIPMAREPESVGTDVTRYWFNPWVLVDDSFSTEEIDLTQAEFYKLLTQIEFKCVTEIVSAVELIVKETDCDGEANYVTYTADNIDLTKKLDMSLKVIDAEKGIVELWHDDLPYSVGSLKTPVKVVVRYKTSPMASERENWIQLIKEAICYLAAAEAPAGTCKCVIKGSFIEIAQQPYTDIRINPITGETIVNLKFGNTYGHLIFSEKISRVQRRYKSIRI